MKYLRKIIFLTLILSVFAMLNACGRYSEPHPIDGSNYPHNYPQH